MKIVDANVLLYAVNPSAPQHRPSLTWLDRALSGADRVGLAWVVTLAFLRLSTQPRIMEHPLSVADASAILADWQTSPSAIMVTPAPGHAERLATMLQQIGTGGNLVNDAHLAVLAVENRGSVVSFDSDFTRFPGVVWQRPDDLL